MTRSSSLSAPEAPVSAYRVGRPRASDAVALSLRDAYCREPDLPQDMAALLHQLNRYDASPRY